MLRVYHKASGTRVVIEGHQALGIVGRSPITVALSPGGNYSVKVATTSVPVSVSVLDEGGSAVYGPVKLEVNSIAKMALVSFPPLEVSSQSESFKLIVAITRMKQTTVVQRASSVTTPAGGRRYVSPPDFSEPLSKTEWVSSKETELIPILFVKSLTDAEV